MKFKSILAALAALPILLFSWNASAVTINFIDLTENEISKGDATDGLGETAWTTLTIPAAFEPNTFGLEITGHATNDNDNQQFAYLDWGTAGLGVCKDAVVDNSSATGNTGNRCLNDDGSSNAGDDNVTDHEYLELVFDQDVVVDNLWFNNNHDGGFGTNSDGSEDMVTIGVGPLATVVDDPGGVFNGNAFDLALGVGIGPFTVLQGEKLWIAFNNEQFYLSAMEVSAVPVPAAIWLFGSALVGFVGFGRRRSIA